MKLFVFNRNTWYQMLKQKAFKKQLGKERLI